MPRTVRDRSKSGIYHITFRGTNRQEIFHVDEDNIRFLETMKDIRDKDTILQRSRVYQRKNAT